MDTYQDLNQHMWDLGDVSNYSAVPDDDFLALLSKQFSNNNQFPITTGLNNVFDTGVNPQSISDFALPGLTPPSDDSSPSPPSVSEGATSRRQSFHRSSEDHGHKRKASDDDDFEEGPSQKAAHTCAFSSLCAPDLRGSSCVLQRVLRVRRRPRVGGESLVEPL